MNDGIVVVKSTKDLHDTILLILNDMWKINDPKIKKVVIKIRKKEIVIVELLYGNLIVYWDNYIEAKQKFIIS